VRRGKSPWPPLEGQKKGNCTKENVKNLHVQRQFRFTSTVLMRPKKPPPGRTWEGKKKTNITEERQFIRKNVKRPSLVGPVGPDSKQGRTGAKRQKNDQKRKKHRSTTNTDEKGDRSSIAGRRCPAKRKQGGFADFTTRTKTSVQKTEKGGRARNRAVSSRDIATGDFTT